MVAGKHDFLSPDARTLIRRAGIFHIITISGVQMTLVSGIFFVGIRRLLALSQTLTLSYPIHKWAAALAILGAILYDLGTGSRVGTQRALVLIGKNPQAFAAEQWLHADADPRPAGDAPGGSCDERACIGRAIDGRYISVVQTRDAFVVDCARVAMIVTPLHAPSGCAAPVVIDRDRLAETGAVTLRFQETAILWTTARESGEDRPWSPPPAPRRKPLPASTSIPEREEAPDDDEPP